MPLVARVLVALLAATAAVTADASAAMRVVDVPGVSGRSVSIAGAARLADGGAIVAGTLTPSGARRARPRIVVIRLRHDGLVDTSFGSSGVVTLQLARGDGPAGSRATAVAADPVRGRSWIGAAVGGNDTGAVLALDGRGRRVQRFGTRSVVRFDGNSTVPTAIAFGNGRLAVAATNRPCDGCQVLLLDPDSGARGAQLALAPVPGANAGRCSGAQIGSLALAGANRLVLGGSGGASCPTRVILRDGGLQPVADWSPVAGPEAAKPARAGPAAAKPAGGPAAAKPARAGPAAAKPAGGPAAAKPARAGPAAAKPAGGPAAAKPARAGRAAAKPVRASPAGAEPVRAQRVAAPAASAEPVRTAVAAAGAPLDLCTGVERGGAVRLVRVSVNTPAPAAATLPGPAWTAVSGSLVAVVPLGDRACGALLRRAGKPALVLQASNGDAKPALAEVPAALRAGAIYRCKRHVLIVGTRRRGGVDRASVAVTPIVRR